VTAATWTAHRDAYAANETTWRKTPAEKLADWSTGCGYCGEPRQDHAPDYHAADVLLGRLPVLSPLTLESLQRAAEKSLVTAFMTPDSPELPVEVAP
jgi:hypothetical protein